VIGPVERTLLDAVIQDEHERQERMRRAWCAYHGDHAKSLDTRDGEHDDNVVMNLARLVADAAVQALYGQEPDWTTGDDAQDAAVEQWMRRRRTASGATSPFLLTLQKAALNGAVTGHAWRKWSTAGMAAGEPPRLRVLDPATVWAFWEEDDHETVYAFKIEWSTISRAGKPVQRRQMIERATDTSWSIRDEERAGDGSGKWKPLGPTLTWPYAWPPIAGTQNLACPNEYWGVADLECDALELQRAVNYSASNLNRIVRLYAHPRDVGYGFTAGEIQTGPGKMLTLPDPKARIETLPTAGDLGGALDVFARLREAMHATTRTPEVAVGKMDTTGALSGVALSILYGPLVAKTEAKRLTYGPWVEDAVAEYLVLAGVASDVQSVEVETTWPEIVPGDPLAEGQALLVDKQLGASSATLLEKRGYDAATETELRQDEDAAKVEAAQRAFDAGATVDAATRQPGPQRPGA
jgi:hypothetical protein